MSEDAIQPLVNFQKKPTLQDQQKTRFYKLLLEDKARRWTEEQRRKQL